MEHTGLIQGFHFFVCRNCAFSIRCVDTGFQQFKRIHSNGAFSTMLPSNGSLLLLDFSGLQPPRHNIVILPSISRFSSWPLLDFPSNCCMYSTLFPCTLHALLLLHHSNYIWRKSASYGAPPYEAFYSLVLFPLSSSQVLSALFTNTLCLCSSLTARDPT